MLGRSSNTNKPQNTIESLIGTTTTIEGNVIFTGGLRIDGTIKGNVGASTTNPEANGTLVVSESAHILGEIRAAHVVINGKVDGPIWVSESLELQPKARVTGDVHYKTLEIHLGATVDGKLEHIEAERGNLKLAANNT